MAMASTPAKRIIRSRFLPATEVLGVVVARRALASVSTKIEAALGHGTDEIFDTSYKAKYERAAFWQKISRWKNVDESMFLNPRWQTISQIDRPIKLYAFLDENLPEIVPARDGSAKHKSKVIEDIKNGMKLAPMSVRLTPYILSRIDWTSPLTDPVFVQFVPNASGMLPDHERLQLDSLGEVDDSPVQGLVHRYPEKVLFLATSVCPVYCRCCTRSYAVGGDTSSVSKNHNKPIMKRWEAIFKYIQGTPAVQDVVVSGGDTIYLLPDQLKYIGQRLLSFGNIKRLRFASKGLCVCPDRLLDPDNEWTKNLIALSDLGRKMGKQVALHTHFNHSSEISWITELAAQRLMESGVTVRNQTVLLRQINDDVATMSTLIRSLADINIQPYYVYQGDMVKGVEDLRTPLQTILDLEQDIRGTIAGFMMPQFVVDLPRGGGKRLAASFKTYDRASGVSTFEAPGTKPGRVFEYYDPITVEQGKEMHGGKSATGDSVHRTGCHACMA